MKLGHLEFTAILVVLSICLLVPSLPPVYFYGDRRLIPLSQLPAHHIRATNPVTFYLSSSLITLTSRQPLHPFSFSPLILLESHTTLHLPLKYKLPPLSHPVSIPFYSSIPSSFPPVPSTLPLHHSLTLTLKTILQTLRTLSPHVTVLSTSTITFSLLRFFHFTAEIKCWNKSSVRRRGKIESECLLGDVRSTLW